MFTVMWCRRLWRRLAWLLVLSGAVRAEEARFVRAVNLNGPALTVDGRAWEGREAADFAARGQHFENQSVPLRPAVDPARARMLRSSTWGDGVEVAFRNVSDGDYQVVLWVWEDNRSETCRFAVNGRTVLEGFRSGAGGTWHRLGPWRCRPEGGEIRVSAAGGAANLSGMELWSGEGSVPAPGDGYNANPTAEELAFFENRIRPLLAGRCHECHSAGAATVRGGLLLDSRAGVRRGGDRGPVVVPGDPGSSLLMNAVRRSDADLAMPPDHPLEAHEIEDLAAWIGMGAPDPRGEDTVAAARERKQAELLRSADWWSLRPLSDPEPPAVRDGSWPRGDLDRFVLAAMEAKGLVPAGDADRRTLIRRVTYDLTGLPPTPEETEAFLADQRPEAFAELVERLLASPRYGERWGRHWLDVVRYADTAGDNSDFPVPQAHRYRDWVIAAVNRDQPYPEFVRDQLAGDLVEGGSGEARRDRIIATGYLAMARRFGSRVDDYPWHLTIEDTIDNLGRAFLGLTLSCARCHDHKFDPISTQDYYALYGIFQSTRYPWPGIELEQKQRDFVPLVSAEEAGRRRDERQRALEEADRGIREMESAQRGSADPERAVLKDALAKRKAERGWLASLPLSEDAYAVSEAPQTSDAAVQRKGDPAHLGETVPRGFPAVLGGATLPPGGTVSGRRELADWIFAPTHPLAARVMVNRVWQHHFGRGLVATANDFGRQGTPPTHPELLDWLAQRFRDDGWSLKALHRRILLSHTWQQSSARPAESAAADPRHEWLSGMPRRRMDAEAIRDTLLLAGGSLQWGSPGPHPFPPPQEWKFTQHNPFRAIYESDYRSVYLMTPRIQRHPMAAVFDGADASASTAGRLTSTTPLQALFFLNDPLVHREAGRLAERLGAGFPDDTGRLDRLFALLFARPPSGDEREGSLRFLQDAGRILAAGGKDRGEAWSALVRSLLRTSEFLWID